MTPKRKAQIETLLRYARLRVDDNPRLAKTIKLCSARLRGKHHNPHDTPAMSRWAETMWR